MDLLELHGRHGRLTIFSVERGPVEIGGALGCDLVLDDPAIAPHHWWIASRGGTIVAHDLSAGRGAGRRERHVPRARRFALGGEYWIQRVEGVPGGSNRDPHTAGAPRLEDAAPAWPTRLQVRLAEPRSYRIDGRPLVVGRGHDADVVLPDRRVSQRHCRLEPHPRGLLVRDLGSRNGTYVRGVHVERAIVSAGAVIRVGGTDLAFDAPAGKVTAPAGLVAASGSLRAVLEEARRHACLSWPVLIHGESGTGKEGLAATLHRCGPRAEGPLVTLNAGALSAELVESELFGHERGAFTGAHQGHRGLFEQAHGGTLFLDEIGELPLPLQARLLRVLETGQVRRVGAEALRPVDVRLVGATHRDLRAMVRGGQFREDLYYRLARLVLEVPPLRERPEDVPALAAHFLEEIAEDVGLRQLSRSAHERLVGHPFFGNARELRNVLSAAAVASAAPTLCAADIDRAIRRVGGPRDRGVGRRDIERALSAHRGNQSAAARALGIPRSTLRDRVGL